MSVAICGACEGAPREFMNEAAFVTHVETVHPERLDEAKTPSGANAPYKIQKRGTKFVVVNNTGEVKATFKDRGKALSYLRALYVNVKGAPKRAEKVKFSGKARQRIPKDKAGEDEGREFKAAARKSAAKTGAALPDGSFPIKTVQDLKNAIQALGRAKNKARAKAHIIARARALGATSQLPDGWKVARGSKDKAQAVLIDCPECLRVFVSDRVFEEHAETVHTA